MFHLIYRLVAVGVLAALFSAALGAVSLPSQVPAWLAPLHTAVQAVKSAFAEHVDVIIILALVSAVAYVTWRGSE